MVPGFVEEAVLVMYSTYKWRNTRNVGLHEAMFRLNMHKKRIRDTMKTDLKYHKHVTGSIDLHYWIGFSDFLFSFLL